MPAEERIISFDTWIAALDEEAKKRGYAGGPLSEQTGRDCWFAYYEEGVSPPDALDQDESYGV